MKTNRAGIELIMAFEGCILTAYPDPATKAEPFTIGYGHTSAAGPPKVVPGMKISNTVADEILVRDLASFEAAVSRLLKRNPNENQFAAMASLTFNIGPGNFAKSSVLRRFNDGNIQGAADAFRLWNKADGRVMKGLERRRETELQLFLRPVDATTQPVPTQPPPDVEPTETSPSKATPRPGARIAGGILAVILAAFAAFAAWMMGIGQ